MNNNNNQVEVLYPKIFLRGPVNIPYLQRLISRSRVIKTHRWNYDIESKQIGDAHGFKIKLDGEYYSFSITEKQAYQAYFVHGIDVEEFLLSELEREYIDRLYR